MISNNIIILGLYLSSIISDAAADATRDNGKKVISHVLEALSVLSLLLVPVWYTGSIGWLLASYILLRIGLFDVVYNKLRIVKVKVKDEKGKEKIIKKRLPICYHGNTGLWDKFVNLFKPYCWAELIGKAILLGAGLDILIRTLK